MSEITIVVVDDEAGWLIDIQRYFASYHLTTFADPQHACADFKTRHYDIAVVDYRMPAMSGLELLREAKQARAYEYGIVCTAYAEQELLQAVQTHNLVNKVVEKPVKLRQLKQIIDQASRICQRQHAPKQPIGGKLIGLRVYDGLR